MKKANVVVVGGGQMGRALVGGMLASGFAAADQLTIIDPNPECRQWWAQQHPDVATGEQVRDHAAGTDVFLLAVKPYLVPDVAAGIAKTVDRPTLVVSIAAGVPLKTLCDHAGHQRVIRVMPNTPSLVGAGASAFCVAAGVTDEDCQWIRQALAGVGTVAQVAENQMDAVTGLSGSGPAYICLVIEALADGGVLAGLPRPLAMTLAAQTVLGTAKMVMETGRHPGELKDAVASPGGTTIAALKVLEEKGLRAALINAVETSARRSGELG
ncbi:Pyrroline-5-carboxylate reductase [Stieleria maiorica]|uniref:Pyrroline-5-carboxylate reductase n=1 Tax=Stieleria maiorica TaxID=2795974 RepID=A0A5B9M7H9_9BACT|nr:pyrroline-5-carboxylate reductase [Stieleria maiorica]QEF96096.1 Pyrroline-5-carboxylate reductase [Stieleria maiorica]